MTLGFFILEGIGLGLGGALLRLADRIDTHSRRRRFFLFLVLTFLVSSLPLFAVGSGTFPLAEGVYGATLGSLLLFLGLPVGPVVAGGALLATTAWRNRSGF